MALMLSRLALAAPPENVPARLQELRALQTAALKGETETLCAPLDAALTAHPQDVNAQVGRAFCDFPTEAAWNALKAVASRTPEVPWAHWGLGLIYLRWRLPDQAERAFRLALTVSPRFYPALAGLGEAQRRLKRPVEAEQSLRAALALQDDAEAHAGLGLLLADQGKPDAARVELSTALSMWPDQPDVLLAMGELTRPANPQEALRYLGRLTQLSPRDKAARRAVARMQEALGEPDLAAKQVEVLLRQGDRDPTLLPHLVELYRAAGNRSGLERALAQLAQRDKLTAALPLELARLAEERGALDESEAHLLEAVRRDPANGDARMALGKMLARRMLLREAMDAYRAAQHSGIRSAELESAIHELSLALHLPTPPAAGTVDEIYRAVSRELFAFYAERTRAKAALGGNLRLMVHVGDAGQVEAVDVLEDTVLDPWLAGNVYFALKDASYPPRKRDALFEFSLKPAGSK